jgi:hypothetical protein
MGAPPMGGQMGGPGMGPGMGGPGMGGPGMGQMAPPPPPPPQNFGAPPPQPYQGYGGGPPQAPAYPTAPLAQPAAPPSAGPAPGSPTLTVYYNGHRQIVNKDRFIIGRGKQSSDLTIKDPNVSRQHAMIEFLNGQYYMVDMGSTNGVEYNGQRIARKAIAEGDLFRICDHEIRFSYR